MASSYVLDTHALLWYLEGNRKLGKRAHAAIASPENHLILPIIVLAEAGIIIDQHRTKIPSIPKLLDVLDTDPRFEVIPLTLKIFRRSLYPDVVQVSELHDRLIVATALYLIDMGVEVKLLTRDENMTESGLLPILW